MVEDSEGLHADSKMSQPGGDTHHMDQVVCSRSRGQKEKPKGLISVKAGVSDGWPEVKRLLGRLNLSLTLTDSGARLPSFSLHSAMT